MEVKARADDSVESLYRFKLDWQSDKLIDRQNIGWIHQQAEEH